MSVFYLLSNSLVNMKGRNYHIANGNAFMINED